MTSWVSICLRADGGNESQCARAPGLAASAASRSAGTTRSSTSSSRVQVPLALARRAPPGRQAASGPRPRCARGAACWGATSRSSACGARTTAASARRPRCRRCCRSSPSTGPPRRAPRSRPRACRWRASTTPPRRRSPGRGARPARRATARRSRGAPSACRPGRCPPRAGRRSRPTPWHDRVVLAITGATGALGGQVARALSRPRAPAARARPGPRARPRARGLPGVVRRRDRPPTAALEGVEVLFMVSAAESEHRRARAPRVHRAAARAGVRHVVYTSFCGAAADATFTLGRDHHDAEIAPRPRADRHGVHRAARQLLPRRAAAASPATTAPCAGRPVDGGSPRVARADVGRRRRRRAARPRRPRRGDVHPDGARGPHASTRSRRAPAPSLGRALRYEPETRRGGLRLAPRGLPRRRPSGSSTPGSAPTSRSPTARAPTVTDDVERLTGHPARTLEQALVSPLTASLTRSGRGRRQAVRWWT